MYRRLKEQAERAAQQAAAELARPARGTGVASAGGAAKPAEPPRASKARRLGFKEQRELDGMEAAILAAEQRKSAAEAALADPVTYQQGGAAVAALRAELEAAGGEAERLYARWQELEAVRSGTDR